MSASEQILPLHQADHAHNVALEAMEREIARQKAEIYKYSQTPGHNPERLKASWAQWHIINNYYNATINLVNSYNNEINKASYLIATSNETNRVLKLRLEAAAIRPAYGAQLKRNIFNYGTERARQMHVGTVEFDLNIEYHNKEIKRKQYGR